MSKGKKSPILISAILGLAGLLCGVLGFTDILRSRVENETYLATWMSEIPDETLISDLSIPGTHNSGALYSVGDMSGQCQELDIHDQLQIGVRFMEFRLLLDGDSLKVVHGISDESLSFASTISTISSFIEDHPNEFVFVSVIQYLPEGTTYEEGQFDTAVKTAITSNETVTKYWVIDSEVWPTSVEEARGKIFQLSRYEGSTFGYPAYEGWVDYDESTTNTFEIGNYLHVQDYYKATDLECKQSEVSECLEYSSTSENMIVMNYTSAYIINSFPPSYVPSMSATMNSWIKGILAEREEKVGFMIGDFVTSSYVEAVIGRNPKNA